MILQVILFIIYIIKLIKHTLRLNIQNKEKLKMSKKLQIFCVILFMSVTKLSATSYDGLFDVKINDWYFSIQWGGIQI